MRGRLISRRSFAPFRGGSRPIHLLVLCGAIIVLWVAASTAILLSNLRASALWDTGRELSNLALVLAEECDRAFESVEIVQRTVIDDLRARGVETEDEFRRDMSDHDIYLTLREKIAALPQIDAVTVIDSDGKLLNFSRRWPIPDVDVADRDYFKALRDDDGLEWYVSAPVPNRGDGTWTIYLARKVRAPSGAFLGLILGALRLQYFEDLYKEIALGDDATISLFRRDGILLARHPHVDPSIGQPYARIGAWKTVLEHIDRGMVRFTSVIDGKSRIAFARTLAHFPVVVSVSTTEAAALSSWREEAIYHFCITLILALVIAGGIRIVARQFKSRELFAKLRADMADAERARAVAEAELLKKERLSVLGQLTATVAHELRNPLSAIRNTIYAVGEAANEKGLKIERPMARIERSIARCDHIISDLLEYTRAREIVQRPVALDEWLGEVLDEQKIPDGIALERRLAAPGLIVELDGERFRRVIINVVDNAIQALSGAPEGGERKITISTLASARAEILIEDTGPGIPSDIIPRIFEPLFSTKSFGTGLGLPTVKQIVEQHSGSVTITSEIGCGTSVHIRLPRPSAKEAAA